MIPPISAVSDQRLLISQFPPINRFQFGHQVITTRVFTMMPRSISARRPWVDVTAAMDDAPQARSVMLRVVPGAPAPNGDRLIPETKREFVLLSAAKNLRMPFHLPEILRRAQNDKDAFSLSPPISPAIGRPHRACPRPRTTRPGILRRPGRTDGPGPCSSPTRTGSRETALPPPRTSPVAGEARQGCHEKRLAARVRPSDR